MRSGSMSLRTLARSILGTTVVLIVISLVLGSALGQPILLSYVETGSMSPTLDPGDGFVAIPTQLSGPIQDGDVVVFEAEEIQGGGLTTHRVVRETGQGYITRGDANPFTDQDSNEPPVKRAQITAKALQISGEVVVIPYLGTVIEGIQSVLETTQRHFSSLLGTSAFVGARGLAYLLFATSLLWYAVGEWRRQNTKRRTRETNRLTGIDSRLVVGAFAALLVFGATAAMVGPAGNQEYGVVSAEFESDKPTVIPTGESNDVAYPVGNSGILPVFVYLEPASDGVDIRPHETRIQSNSVVNATVTLDAPSETGYYRRFVTEHRYLAILPQSIIRALYQFHPWAPVVVIDALIGIPFYLVGITLSGSGRVRNRSRDRDLSVLVRLRRMLRSFY